MTAHVSQTGNFALPTNLPTTNPLLGKQVRVLEATGVHRHFCGVAHLAALSVLPGTSATISALVLALRP